MLYSIFTFYQVIVESVAQMSQNSQLVRPHCFVMFESLQKSRFVHVEYIFSLG